MRPPKNYPMAPSILACLGLACHKSFSSLAFDFLIFPSPLATCLGLCRDNLLVVDDLLFHVVAITVHSKSSEENKRNKTILQHWYTSHTVLSPERVSQTHSTAQHSQKDKNVVVSYFLLRADDDLLERRSRTSTNDYFDDIGFTVS